MFDVLDVGFLPVTLVIIIIASIIVSVAANLDKPLLCWIAVVWFIFATVLVAIFFPQWVYKDCPYCGKLPVSGAYCSNCGADLVDDCICGHVWVGDQTYCPECGNVRE